MISADETPPAIIPFHYQGQTIPFDTDGSINATVAAARFGKAPGDWLRLPETASYVVALTRVILPQINSVIFEELSKIKDLDSSKASTQAKLLRLVKSTGLVKTKAGSIANGGGTWLHPKLAVVFARWLSVDFAVWCDLHIDALLSSDPAIRRGYGVATQRLEDRKKKASKDGSNLAHFRWDKPNLVEGVTYWKEQLQLTLGLEDATNDSRK